MNKVDKEKQRKEGIINLKTEEFLNMSSEDLKKYEDAWYPGGSGPINAMYTITALLRALAEARGLNDD